MKGFPLFLSRVILWGTLVAAAVIAVGLVWFLVTHPGTPPGDHIFSGEPKMFRDPVTMVQVAMEPSTTGHRRSLIMIGVVLLLVGPLVRVALAGVGYLLEKDRLYAGVSAVVFGVLVLSFFW